jgi:RimJ/RimL family protein N-acetyltransferase
MQQMESGTSVQVERSAKQRHVTIRRSTKDDAVGMAAFLSALQAENLDTICRRDPPSENEVRALLDKVAADTRSFFLVATSDDEIVGLLDFWAGESSHSRHSAKFGVSVGKYWRGRGVAKELTEAAIREAKLWPHFCRIELECAAHNEGAIYLYESLGFVTEGRKRKSMDLGNGPEDMILMALVW